MTVAARLEIDVANDPRRSTGGPTQGTSSAQQAGSAGLKAEGLSQDIPINSTQNRTEAPHSFRSNWEQVVATFNNPENAETSAAIRTGLGQRPEEKNQPVSSPKNGAPALGAVSSLANSEPNQSQVTQPEQSSSAILQAALARGRHFATVTSEATTSGPLSFSGNPGRAKHTAAEKPAITRTIQSQPGSQSFADASILMVPVVTAAVQPVKIANAAATTGAHLNTAFPSDTITNSHGIAGEVNHEAPRLTSGTLATKAEPNAGNIGSQGAEAPESTGEIPASQLSLRSHSPETTDDRLARADSGQAVTEPERVSAGFTAAQSVSSDFDDPAIGSLSSSAALLARAQVAAAHPQSGARGSRGDRVFDLQPVQPQAMQSMMQGTGHQINSATLDATAIRETATLPANSVPGATARATSGVSTEETFSALDGAGDSMHATWIHAGAHQAEAGFEDPSLGWVSVRAGLNAGSISAVVVPNSAEATQTLGAHMAGLNDHLRAQHSSVDSLTLATAQNSSADSGMGQGMGHQGYEQPAQNSPDSDRNFGSVSPASNVENHRHVTSAGGREGTAVLPLSGGTHISVMA